MLTTIQFLYVIFVFLGRPHKKSFDLFRGLTIEISLLYILLTRYLEVSIFPSIMQERANI